MGFGQIYIWGLFRKKKSTALLKQCTLLFFKPGRSLENLQQDANVGVVHADIYQH